MGTRRGSPLLVWPIYTIPPAQLTSDQTNRRSSVVSETNAGQDKGGETSLGCLMLFLRESLTLKAHLLKFSQL